ncbi:redoxin domain-containing protein [bacterium]|nr:redoxin domain-containing protein [bacterium]MCI0604875.1 redoxin domain-containing protein [bacterium]
MKYSIFSVLLFLIACSSFANEPAPPLPSKSSDWLEGKPFGWSQLKGKVVLMNVWTFRCWNSYRSLPWVVSLKTKFPQMELIGIHSPEFDHEKDRNKLRETMASYKVTYPQVLDDDFAYWRQLNNRYWPAFYVVDKQGKIRGKFAGETHPNDSQAKRIEGLIEELMKESL